jgi:3-oxoacyl-[acyl-carrier protein] reductase
MDLDLQRKVAVVTGTGKGIGLAAAKALADEGAQVVAGSLHTDGLDALNCITPVAQRRGGPHAHGRILRHER